LEYSASILITKRIGSIIKKILREFISFVIKTFFTKGPTIYTTAALISPRIIIVDAAKNILVLYGFR
jgi:hypothetical protein